MLYAADLDVSDYVRTFKALGDRTRLSIIACLAFGELSVNELVDVLGISQPNASRQLGILRNARLVRQRRAKNFVYYRLVEAAIPDAFQAHLKLLATHFKNQHNLKDALKQFTGKRRKTTS
jgi:ArsR family transcriptional regulator